MRGKLINEIVHNDRVSVQDVFRQAGWIFMLDLRF
jgi:hypothetical protein